MRPLSRSPSNLPRTVSATPKTSYLGLLYSIDDVAVYAYITPLNLKIVLAFALADAVIPDIKVHMVCSPFFLPSSHFIAFYRCSRLYIWPTIALPRTPSLLLIQRRPYRAQSGKSSTTNSTRYALLLLQVSSQDHGDVHPLRRFRLPRDEEPAPTLTFIPLR